MVKCDCGMVEFRGPMIVIMGEVTCLLNALYQKMVENMGVEEANNEFARMGRIAVMSDDEVDEQMGDIDERLREAHGDEFVDSLNTALEGLRSTKDLDALKSSLDDLRDKM